MPISYGQCVRLTRPLLGVAQVDEADKLIPIPQAAVVRLSEPLPDERFLTVQWNNRLIQLFKSDLEELGTFLGEPS